MTEIEFVVQDAPLVLRVNTDISTASENFLVSAAQTLICNVPNNSFT